MIPILVFIGVTIIFERFGFFRQPTKLLIDKKIVLDAFVAKFIEEAENSNYVYRNIEINYKDIYGSLLKIIGYENFYYSEYGYFFQRVEILETENNIAGCGYYFSKEDQLYILEKVIETIDDIEKYYSEDTILSIRLDNNDIIQDINELKKFKEEIDIVEKNKRLLYNYLLIRNAILKEKYDGIKYDEKGKKYDEREIRGFYIHISSDLMEYE